MRDHALGGCPVSVRVATDPSSVLTDAEALKAYDLFFVDYCGSDWTDAARANFESAIRGGTGLALLHGATVGFKGWTELEKMAALCWREGTAHGDYHEFTVRITDREHPITHGMEDFTTWDELYHKMVPMHGADHHVLATAYSAPEKKGTGAGEPMMIVSQYGRGRVFYQILGHVWPGDPAGRHKGTGMTSLENESFQRSLLRGCQWAATGSVTLP